MYQKRGWTSRMLSILLAICLVLALPMSAMGTDGATENTEGTTVTAQDGNVVFTYDVNTTVLTLSGSGETSGTSSGNALPAEFKDYYTSITKVVVGADITKLGNRLFYNCSALTEVEFAENSKLAELGDCVFQNCKKLVTISPIPATVTTIGFGCFLECHVLESIEILGPVTELSGRTFTNCKAIKSITLPSSITTLNVDSSSRSAFYKCGSSDTKIIYGGTEAEWTALMTSAGSVVQEQVASFTIICSDTDTGDSGDSGDDGADDTVTNPSGTTGAVNWTLDLETGVFTLSGTGATAGYANQAALPWCSNISDIKKVVIEEGVTELGNRLFYGADNLTEVVFPASTLSIIGEGTFRACTALKTITLPASLTVLGRAQFYGCTALEEVVIQSGLTSLDELVVGNCSKLTTVTIPQTVTKLSGSGNKNTFYNCTSLTTIKFGGTIQEWKYVLARGEADPVKSASITVICSDGEYHYDPNETLPTPPEEEGSDDQTVVSGTTGQVKWTLDRTTGVFTLSGTGVTADYASTTVGANGTTNGKTDWADYMDEITKVVVEEGVTKLGNRLFYGADKLTEVVFPATSLTSIGVGTFRLCNALEEITLPDSLTDLARVAFYSCANLKKVVLGTENSKLNTLNDQTFYLCNNLKEITIPASVKTLNFSGTKGPLTNTPLDNIYYTGTVAQWEAFLAGTTSTDVKKGSITVHCSDGIYIDGDIGNGITYSLSGGVLTLEARTDIGDMIDYASAADLPWANEADTITRVIIKGNITSIGANAFAGCTNIQTVTYIGTEQGWNSIKAKSGSGNDPLFNATVSYLSAGKCGEQVTYTYDTETKKLVISGTGATYDYTSGSLTPWGIVREEIVELVVEEGVTYLGDYLFNKAYSLTSVTLPNTLREIGTFTLAQCTSLTEITIPEGVEIIGSKAFSGAANLKVIHLPGTLKYVDMKAFENAAGLTDVYYNGTQGDWDQIIISESALGNGTLLRATRHLLKTAQTFTDVSADSVYSSAVEYLTDNGYLTVNSEQFGADSAADMEMVLTVLYVRAGKPGIYASAWSWATNNGLVTSEVNGNVSLEQLAETLLLTAVLNQTFKDSTEISALEWCAAQGYFAGLSDTADTTAALTRAEAALVLAAYLQSDASYADRTDEQVNIIKAALANGGDGKLYIYALNTTTVNASSKPGDCTLIVFPDGKTMLIDTAISTSQSKVISALKALEITSLDYLVISHPHTDHVGNAVAVVNYLKENGGSVGIFYRGAYDYNSYVQNIENALAGTTTEVVTLWDGDVLTIGDVTINVYNPTKEEVDALIASGSTGDEQQNAISLAMKFTYGTSTYLTCGDLYVNQENILVKKYGSALQADVFNTNHHGAYTSNGDLWMDTVNPIIAFVESDDIGSTPLYELCTERGIAFYAFGLDGAILISMDNAKNYEVITQYDSVLRSGYTGEDAVPDTGDHQNVEMLFVMMVGVAVLAMAAVLLKRRTVV